MKATEHHFCIACVCMFRVLIIVLRLNALQLLSVLNVKRFVFFPSQVTISFNIEKQFKPFSFLPTKTKENKELQYLNFSIDASTFFPTPKSSKQKKQPLRPSFHGECADLTAT